jgi:hypothetical protein
MRAYCRTADCLEQKQTSRDMGQQQRTSSDAASVRRDLTAPSRHEAHVGKRTHSLRHVTVKLDFR